MKLINVNGFLTREVMGGRKSCSEYIFPKKSPQVCSAVIILDLEWKFLRIWSHLLKKSLMENFNFCAVFVYLVNLYQ